MVVGTAWMLPGVLGLRYSPFCGTIEMFVCLLFYTIATVFQLYLGNEMIYEMRKEKGPSLHFLPTHGIFNLPHHIGMQCDELDFDDAVSYTQKWIAAWLHVMAMTGFILLSPGGHQPSALTN